jgi:hypothetical protein
MNMKIAVWIFVCFAVILGKQAHAHALLVFGVSKPRDLAFITCYALDSFLLLRSNWTPRV